MSEASFLSRLGSWIGKSIVPSFLRPRWGGRRALGTFIGSSSSLGPFSHSWSDNRYEMVRHFRHWVYVAIDRIATTCAMHQPNVSLVRDLNSQPYRDASEERRLLTIRNKALTPLKLHEALEPVGSTHPLVRLFEDPNEPDTSYDLFYETVMYLKLTGNSYWWLPPNAFGKPGAIWVLPAHWVYPRIGKNGDIETYDLRPVEGNYLRFAIPSADVIHFRSKSPISKIDGYGALTAGNQWVDTQESMDRTRWFSFRNGIFPGVSVEFDAGVKLPNETDLDRIEARLMSRYGNEHNANRPLMVPPGAHVKKVQLTPNELMFCESEDQLRDQILALFGVPSSIAMVVADQSYGALLSSQAGFFMHTINPLFRYLGGNTTEKLARPRYDRNLRTWWEDRTPQDPELLERQLATDLAYGARTMNEVRQLRGKEPYEGDWANEPWIPLNTVPLSVALRIGESRSEHRSTLLDAPGSSGDNRATQSSPGNIPQGGEKPDPR